MRIEIDDDHATLIAMRKLNEDLDWILLDIERLTDRVKLMKYEEEDLSDLRKTRDAILGVLRYYEV